MNLKICQGDTGKQTHKSHPVDCGEWVGGGGGVKFSCDVTLIQQENEWNHQELLYSKEDSFNESCGD